MHEQDFLQDWSQGRPRIGLAALAAIAIVVRGAWSDAAFAQPISAVDAVPRAEQAWSPPTGVLHLVDKGFAAGHILPCVLPGRLCWQSPNFRDKFVFALETIADVQFHVPDLRPQPLGRYCFELLGGDVLYGDLLAVDGEQLKVNVTHVGVATLRREQVVRWYRWNQGGQLIYLGPNGLAGWNQSPADSWRDEGGHLCAQSQPGYVQANLGLPPQAAIEFELTWKSNPQFVFALGVGENDAELSYKHAHRFEIWDSELVVRCESHREADVDTVEAISDAKGRASYIAYLDQIQGRMLVYSVDRGKLAEIQVTPTQPQAKPGIRLMHKRGDVRLERLRITGWDGTDPQGNSATDARVHMVDGRTISGVVSGFSKADDQLTIQAADGPLTVAANDVLGIYGAAAANTQSAPFRVVYQDGTRLTGKLGSIGHENIALEHHAFIEALQLPQAGLQSLVVLERTAETEAAAPASRRTGRLELKDSVLYGVLVDSRERADASCLNWLPAGSVEPSSLHIGQTGRIVYRDPPPPPKPVTTTTTNRANAFGGIFIRRAVPTTPSTNLTTRPSKEKNLHLFLRTGDAITYESATINEEGVLIKTELSDATFVPHHKIKALELAAGSPPQLSNAKRERLLMLPRLQRDSPPTQLICSKTGDVLRGRVIDMDEAQLRVELRLDTKELPRDRLSQIIWLHADEMANASSKTPDVPAKFEAAESKEVSTEVPAGTRVQALHRDGIRLTFWANAVVDSSVSGTSDVLGACRADMALVDQLLFGDAIESAAAELAYQQWKLHPAIEPRIAQDLGTSGDGGMSGLESVLVGKPAPDFELNLLDGSRFHLAQSRGRVVVLDFWATWCGPCLQTLPMVHGVAEEFADKGLQLIAVNLEEPAKQIEATLERHKLPLTVALDRDGVVAAKYEAMAIPQTVVIDQDGKIVRLFVGGGPQLGDELRKVLQDLTAPKP